MLIVIHYDCDPIALFPSFSCNVKGLIIDIHVAYAYEGSYCIWIKISLLSVEIRAMIH